MTAPTAATLLAALRADREREQAARLAAALRRAEVLRRAAAAMRERAEAATPGPWERSRYFWKVGSTRGLPDEWWVSIESSAGAVIASMPEEAPPSEPNAEHIASWHPAVALAVANWLDLVTRRASTGTAETKAALAVARTYLGEQP